MVNVFAQLPNLNIFPVTHKGFLRLTPYLTLQDVLCVPQFTFNIVSFSKLNLQNSTRAICDIQDPIFKMKIR